ncbi:MAG: hydrogenase iron-sulfur subunit [Deltaproteobacteria bacterium]|nr:hydrogenase iron-sulfur subunit [Deltaproteobacteria bacterium]MBW1978400.1 hydrogenase iron-sulfur subunit [Deltaproteobacteria bacterium]MBW2300713.1 hydrogenase iron-sulfur subunit [Deltaproteobacteria bacterium]
MDIRKRSLALFYCQNVPQSGIKQRQALEKLYGPSIKLFPLPCSGRLEPLHLLRALEEFADAAYVVTCPEGACRYFEGNLRARKRVELARKIIASIGLEEDRVGIVMNEKERQKSLADFAKELMSRVSGLRPSPVLRPRTGFEDPERKQGDKL